MLATLKNQLVSVVKPFDFVTAEDSPPYDCRGKSNLLIDDMAWSRNDAFLILAFNTGALAVLPRQGNQLLRVFNPTIINVHYKDAANFATYREPRGFNELILKTDIASKVKKVNQHVASSSHRLAMHPSQEAFIVYTGKIEYIMELELSSSRFGEMFHNPAN